MQYRNECRHQHTIRVTHRYHGPGTCVAARVVGDVRDSMKGFPCSDNPMVVALCKEPDTSLGLDLIESDSHVIIKSVASNSLAVQQLYGGDFLLSVNGTDPSDAHHASLLIREAEEIKLHLQRPPSCVASNTPLSVLWRACTMRRFHLCDMSLVAGLLLLLVGSFRSRALAAESQVISTRRAALMEKASASRASTNQYHAMEAKYRGETRKNQITVDTLLKRAKSADASWAKFNQTVTAEHEAQASAHSSYVVELHRTQAERDSAISDAGKSEERLSRQRTEQIENEQRLTRQKARLGIDVARRNSTMRAQMAHDAAMRSKLESIETSFKALMQNAVAEVEAASNEAALAIAPFPPPLYQAPPPTPPHKPRHGLQQSPKAPG